MDAGRLMTRLRIVHTTRIDYERAVRTSYNELRMTPASLPGQTALEARIEISPRSSAFHYRDYWTTHVVAFDTQAPHTTLEVVATSVVEVEPPGTGPVAHGYGWEELRSPQVRDSHVEWLTPRVATDIGPELTAQVADLAAGSSPHEAALAVCGHVRSELAYVPGSTGVHTSAVQAWQERRGVCQDFAHVVVGALRCLGVPARYVSGYLHPDAGAPVGQPVVGQSHAWVEWWVGEWVAFDPTNGLPAGGDHVLVARGRDYTDVSPFTGVYSGTAGSTMTVTVEVTRIR